VAHAKYAARTLRLSPAFTIVVVVTLALDVEGPAGADIHCSVPEVRDFRSGIVALGGIAEYSPWAITLDGDSPARASRRATSCADGAGTHASHDPDDWPPCSRRHGRPGESRLVARGCSRRWPSATRPARTRSASTLWCSALQVAVGAGSARPEAARALRLMDAEHVLLHGSSLEVMRRSRASHPLLGTGVGGIDRDVPALCRAAYHFRGFCARKAFANWSTCAATASRISLPAFSRPIIPIAPEESHVVTTNGPCAAATSLPISRAAW
jgi:hypothetical protein